MHIEWRPTLFQKMYIILRDFPEIRESYDLIVEKWIFTYNEKQTRDTIMRISRYVQYDAWIYPPSYETKKRRLAHKERIIEEKKVKKSVFYKIGKLLSKIF